MKYCAHCGKEIIEDAVICTNCGCLVHPVKTHTQPKQVGKMAMTGFILSMIGVAVSAIVIFILTAANNSDRVTTVNVIVPILIIFLIVAMVFCGGALVRGDAKNSKNIKFIIAGTVVSVFSFCAVIIKVMFFIVI